MSTEGKTIHCKAAVLWNEGQPLTIEDITVDPPKEGEVRVRMVAAGVCATDAHLVWGSNTDLKLPFEGKPVVLGHEGSGIVETIGHGVTSVAPGDKVILVWRSDCGKCALCANPKNNGCVHADWADLLYHDNRETRMKINGKPLLSFGGTSTYSQYSVVREIQIVKINPNADLNTCSIIGCAVGTGYGSATNIAKVHKGSRCAVWGLGAIGLSAVLGCKESGAETIIGIDINPDKESIARQMGCTRFVNPKTLDKPIEELLQSEGGIDYAFDCIGSQKVLESGLKSLNFCGTLTVIGLGAPGDKLVVPTMELLLGKHLTGGIFGNLKPKSSIQSLVDRHCSGSLPIDPLITHRMSLTDINKAFDGLKAGQTVRTVIEF